MYRSKILLVDDDTDITISLKIGLEDNGFIVDAFNDPLLAIINKPANVNLKLKSHIFNPEIFFSKLCLFVEGATDEYAIKAIDDYLNNIFEENDILLVNIGSKNNV